MQASQYQVQIHFSINNIKKTDWNNFLIEIKNPFYTWEWLLNLEKSKSVSKETGWQPLYFSINLNNEIVAIAPLFIKNHSFGEFIFETKNSSKVILESGIV